MTERCWRREPPTVAEVRRCQWWWNRAPGVLPHVMQLDIEDGKIFDASDPHPAPIIFADWGGNEAEWAPCAPPEAAACTPTDGENMELAVAAQLIAEARKHDAAMTEGPWEVWTSNSFRRITAQGGQDGGVLSGTIQRHDGQPDLGGRNRDADLAGIAWLGTYRRCLIELAEEAVANRSRNHDSTPSGS